MTCGFASGSSAVFIVYRGGPSRLHSSRKRMTPPYSATSASAPIRTNPSLARSACVLSVVVHQPNPSNASRPASTVYVASPSVSVRLHDSTSRSYRGAFANAVSSFRRTALLSAASREGVLLLRVAPAPSPTTARASSSERLSITCCSSRSSQLPLPSRGGAGGGGAVGSAADPSASEDSAPGLENIWANTANSLCVGSSSCVSRRLATRSNSRSPESRWTPTRSLL
mmetsp:Transcript_24976/g.78258  ORF Transcript_24976/g.78258 Transcript_24976/m.78258 type:complete len:227 (-) Transcript_24976:114-794(-)